MHPIFFSVKRTFLTCQRHQRRALEEHALDEFVTPQQLDVLRIVWERGVVMRWQLVELLGVQPAAVSRMLNRLENRDFITRTPWAHDERFVEVKLTEIGEVIVRAAMRTVCAERALERHEEAITDATPSKAEDVELLRVLLLAARIGMQDDAKFVHPWMRVETNRGWDLRHPPTPDAIWPPRAEDEEASGHKTRAAPQGSAAPLGVLVIRELSP
jgi:DNA-binding MarR family transcriptional regulator